MSIVRRSIWRDVGDELRETKALLVVERRENILLRDRATYLEHRVNELERQTLRLTAQLVEGK